MKKILIFLSFSLAIFSGVLFSKFTYAAPCTDSVCISDIGTSNITTNSVTITWTTNVPSNSQVQYGPTTRYGVTTPLNSNLVTDHSVTITGLNQSSTYNYKVSSAAGGFTASSANLQFTTSSPPPTGSVIISGEVVGNITQTAATITWTTNVPSTSQVEYGPTTRYGNLTPVDSTLTTSHSVTISGLNAGTAYNYRTISTANGFTAQGSNRQFTMLSSACTDTVCISNIVVSNITSGGAIVTWTTNIPADSQVEYGPRAPIYDLRTPVISNLTTSHRVSITNLTQNFLYNYRTVSSTSDFTARSSNGQFTTSTASGGAGPGGGGTPYSPTAPQTYSFSITNPLQGGPNDLFDIINIVTQWILYISVPLAVLWIMYAGFLMLTAGPNPANFQKGRGILTYVVIGLAIIFIGKGFVSLIISVIELGGTSTPPTTQGSGNQPTNPGSGGAELPAGTMVYGCYEGFCSGPTADTDGLTNISTSPTCNDACPNGGTNGGVNGSICSNSAPCVNGLECKSTMCRQSGGNFNNDPCINNQICRFGSRCDLTQVQVIDGRNLGTCVPNSQ